MLLLQLTLLLCACHGVAKPPPVSRLATDAKLLAFGDSLTAGYGASESEAYPAQLATLIGHEVFNAGVSGETSSEGRARLPGVLDEVKPALVILCEGGNDMLRRQDPSAMVDNLAAMIQLIKDRGIGVVLIGVPEPKLMHTHSNPVYAELGKRFAVPIEDAIMPRVLSDRAKKSDEIHPNAAGYREIAEALADLLRRAGAV